MWDTPLEGIFSLIGYPSDKIDKITTTSSQFQLRRKLMADLEVRDLSKSYPTRSGDLEILSGVSFELNRGENLAILGPSGSGKSTLLHCLGTLESPTSGTILLEGQNPFELPEAKLADFRNEQIGFVFQDHHLLPQCTVLENVLLPTLAKGKSSQEAIERAKSLLDRVGLGERHDHRPAEISGGERQRTALARALILQPLLLLADEPTGNLDRSTAAKVSELLLELQNQENFILVVVTHSLELAQQMERQAELNEGTLPTPTSTT
ncbi:Lipoprotein-releasing system ATP-binding protein LolD [Planctomycetales bacterium 10988]|nr:Lipoprotein-releasing system ATP-binding protein LolD [Planctomycetales bacterium 10988]